MLPSLKSAVVHGAGWFLGALAAAPSDSSSTGSAGSLVGIVTIVLGIVAAALPAAKALIEFVQKKTSSSERAVVDADAPVIRLRTQAPPTAPATKFKAMKRVYLGGLVLGIYCIAFAAWSYFIYSDFPQWWRIGFPVFLGLEGIVLLTVGLTFYIQLRGRSAGEPISSCEAELLIEEAFNAVAARCGQALVDLNALRATASRIALSPEDSGFLEGHTRESADRGERITLRFTREGESYYRITVVSASLRPSLRQRPHAENVRKLITSLMSAQAAKGD